MLRQHHADLGKFQAQISIILTNHEYHLHSLDVGGKIVSKWQKIERKIKGKGLKIVFGLMQLYYR